MAQGIFDCISAIIWVASPLAFCVAITSACTAEQQARAATNDYVETEVDAGSGHSDVEDVVGDHSDVKEALSDHGDIETEMDAVNDLNSGDSTKPKSFPCPLYDADDVCCDLITKKQVSAVCEPGPKCDPSGEPDYGCGGECPSGSKQKYMLIGCANDHPPGDAGPSD